MPDRQVTEVQLQWAIEQQQLVVEAAAATVRWAERLLAQAGTARAEVEAQNRVEVALLDVEMAEERLLELQRQMAVVTATATRSATKRARRAMPGQGALFDVG
jgi:hypothetical protein